MADTAEARGWGQWRRAAQREGWDLFCVDLPNTPAATIMLLDRPSDWNVPCRNPRVQGGEPLWATDRDAWVHVRATAEAGSELHSVALAILLSLDPAEYDRIITATERTPQ